MSNSVVLMFILRYGVAPLVVGLVALAVFEWVWDKIADWRTTR